MIRGWLVEARPSECLGDSGFNVGRRGRSKEPTKKRQSPTALQYAVSPVTHQANDLQVCLVNTLNSAGSNLVHSPD